MRGHTSDGFGVECTVFRWACTSVCGIEDEANFARASNIISRDPTVSQYPQENNVISFCMKVGT